VVTRFQRRKEWNRGFIKEGGNPVCGQSGGRNPFLAPTMLSTVTSQNDRFEFDTARFSRQ
jgi:hypothetical protein